MCAKLVLNKKKYDSATKYLRELHWLPIEQRIQHKILLISHKALSGQAPKYIHELIKIKTPCRQLRSRSSGRLLSTPNIKKKHSPLGHSAMLVWYHGTPYHHTFERRTPLPYSRNTLKHIFLKKLSTCKAHEIVSYCILITALYQMLYYVMLLCYVMSIFDYHLIKFFVTYLVCIVITSFVHEPFLITNLPQPATQTHRQI